MLLPPNFNPPTFGYIADRPLICLGTLYRGAFIFPQVMGVRLVVNQREGKKRKRKENIAVMLT